MLFAAGVTQVGPRVAIRWYSLSATNHMLLETGTISDPSLDLYWPSIAANTNGAVVLAFNGSGTNTFPSCYAAVGQTVNGVTTFGNLLLLKSGVASYQNLDPSGDNLWGRYSTVCVDPADPNIFWTINAYAAGPRIWATQITQILTSPTPQISLSNAGGNLGLSWPVTTVPFQFQSAADLTDTNSWQPVLLPPATNGTAVSLVVPATNASAFFRLVQTQ